MTIFIFKYKLNKKFKIINIIRKIVLEISYSFNLNKTSFIK